MLLGMAPSSPGALVSVAVLKIHFLSLPVEKGVRRRESGSQGEASDTGAVDGAATATRSPAGGHGLGLCTGRRSGWRSLGTRACAPQGREAGDAQLVLLQAVTIGARCLVPGPARGSGG